MEMYQFARHTFGLLSHHVFFVSLVGSGEGQRRSTRLTSAVQLNAGHAPSVRAVPP